MIANHLLATSAGSNADGTTPPSSPLRDIVRGAAVPLTELLPDHERS